MFGDVTMQFAESNRLLDPTPMPLEMGYERLDNGVLHVAVRTDMHRCKGEMFEWWFRFQPKTREYIWWHPHDHVHSEWIETRPGTHVGSIHQVRERFTKLPESELSIQFRDASEFFDAAALTHARAQGAVSGLICARGGYGFAPQRTPADEVIGTRLIHLCRDTEWGMVLRTHFFFGHDLPALGVPATEMTKIFADELGPAMLQHAYDEFTYLSRFLPSVYAGENRDQIKLTRPW